MEKREKALREAKFQEFLKFRCNEIDEKVRRSD